MSDAPALRQALLEWYDAHRRELPWRSEPGGYRTLVSEVMLQQTQVKTVLPYFERWMVRFPDVRALAAAPIEDALAQWAGLGYYRRAHNLHRAAQQIVADHGGVFPEDFDAILGLPGVGRYTAGAIASIAFEQRRPIVDGNVARVLCRLRGMEGDPTKNPTQGALWTQAEELVPTERPGDFNQALMELGALVCVRAAPSCETCPWRDPCVARASGRQAELPTPRKRPTRQHVVAAALLLVAPSAEDGPRVLLTQRVAGGLWSGLWEPPTLELSRRPRAGTPRGALGASGARQMAAFAGEALGLEVSPKRPGAPIVHTLTHLEWLLIPWRVDVAKVSTPTPAATLYPAWSWVSAGARADFAVSKPVRTLLDRVWGEGDP